MKKVNKQQVNNQQVNNNGCQHVQLGGVAFYDEGKCFMFSPENEGVRNKVEGFRSQGICPAADGRYFRLHGETKNPLAGGTDQKAGSRTCEQDQGRSYSAHPEGVLRRGNQYRQHSGKGGRRGC